MADIVLQESQGPVGDHSPVTITFGEVFQVGGFALGLIQFAREILPKGANQNAVNRRD